MGRSDVCFACGLYCWLSSFDFPALCGLATDWYWYACIHRKKSEKAGKWGEWKKSLLL